MVLRMVKFTCGGILVLAAALPCLAVLKSHMCSVDFDKGTGIGLLKETFTKKMYCAYLGIPYVQPPVGELRFEDPVPFIFAGTGHFNKPGAQCLQDDDKCNELACSEDCLYLNVYTPKIKRSHKSLLTMPVLVWIHGGSFVEGSSETDIFGSDFFLDENLIVVTINYRLGPYGFLGIEDLNIPANLGLKDQTEALRWVQRNIGSFGGDPARVTLMGWSAGAASATYHLYSPASKGLFQRAIAMSGTMSQPWAYNFLNQWCSNEFLHRVDATTKEELKARAAKFIAPNIVFRYFTFDYLCWMPSGDTIYAPRHPFEIVQTMAPISDVPLLVGETALELENLYNEREFVMGRFNYPNDNVTIYERVKGYIEQTGSNRSAKVFYRKLASMADIKFGVHYFVEQASNHFKAPIYRYRFSFDGPFGYAKNVLYRTGYPVLSGAMHGDDLGYLFTPYNYAGIVAPSSNVENKTRELLAKKALRIQRRMVRLWTNFIKHGNPTHNTVNWRNNQTIVWHPYNDPSGAKRRILHIDQQIREQTDRTEENFYYQLWNTVFNCLYYFQCQFLENLTEYY
ncbi:venom carboxylesterase-6-like [Uranotaenia lowii]|uniref:venom carboxylesterase-6-like n=1 Tax=Uranotaenia lowii TaxID=190385 RepID=UPI002478C9D1|nr:venom carboxylesterase-6-like [Uranotaenia lowii]